MQDIEFGNRLYRLRKKAGLSQAQLGEKVGVSNKAVSKWENGLAKPGLEIVHRLADTLSVSVDELLSMPAEEKQISKNHNKPRNSIFLLVHILYLVYFMSIRHNSQAISTVPALLCHPAC